MAKILQGVVGEATIFKVEVNKKYYKKAFFREVQTLDKTPGSLIILCLQIC